MKIAIVGFDTEGRATFDYFKSLGHDIEIRDQNSEVKVPESATSLLGDGYLDNLDQFDLVVRTAGLPPSKIFDKNPGLEAKITTHINEFFKACPTNNIIGITGTKGKGTTSTLTAKMLEAAGKHVKLGGNIGVPPLTFLDELKPDSWVVLELSSFQLIDVQASPHIAVCLMVVPEHLNWHPDINEYTEAKSQIFAHQSEDDIAIYFADNELSRLIASASHGKKIPYYTNPGAFIEDGSIKIDGQTVCKTSDLKLLGEHNWQNACAAVTAAWQVSKDIEAMKAVLTSFSGLPFRLELVREFENVKYYNDSFGTTPETAIVAIKAFEEPKIVILGGADKGASYDELAKTVANSQVRTALLIGDQAGKIQEALERAGFTNFKPGGSNMVEIVDSAHQAAEDSDIVLLSPACTSFDMFKNYKDRGEKFTKAVQALA